jgi:hypothetical protein
MVLLRLAESHQEIAQSERHPASPAKRNRRHRVPGGTPKQRNRVERWLDDSFGYDVEEATDTMPRKRSALASLLDDSLDTSTTSSRRKYERSAVSVHDSNYRESLRQRNIHINNEDPSEEMMRRARRLVCHPRESPELDDDPVQKIVKTSRLLEEEGEEVIKQQLASTMIPAMMKVPDSRLRSTADQLWSNHVPLPLKAGILMDILPLPKPKPDLAFGYSAAAFSDDQLGTMGLLIDDQGGRSYSTPDQLLRFPFLGIEFKSQAKNGTHFIGTNQAAGAGAIATNGIIDLMQRSSRMKDFDYDEPQFFSVTMDNELARINFHWIQTLVKDGQDHYRFHVETVSKHLLDDAKGIRAVVTGIKNILDRGTDVRLQTICSALDAYRDIVVRDRKAADAQRIAREAPQPLGVPQVQDQKGVDQVSERTITEP